MNNVFSPGSDSFIENLIDNNKEVDDALMFADIFEGIINFTEMTLLLFSIIVIRKKENEIIGGNSKENKSHKFIKKILKENFKAPSVGTLNQWCPVRNLQQKILKG
ncbi:MAG: hypothetical protein U9P37_03300 [Pseudomonadota bacterium]|nr:hypothetical protein [Pseudomonadota bacterium]